MAFIVYKLINNEEPYLTDDFSYEMNVARTTIINDIKKIKEILASYNLSINGKPNNGIILQGNELDIRKFILENIYEIIYEDFQIDDDIIDFIKETTDKYKFDKTTWDLFIKSLTISFDRVINGYPISTLSNEYGELLRSWEFNLVTYIIEEISQHIQITEEILNLVSDIIERVRYKMGLNITEEDILDDFVYHMAFLVNRLKYGVRINNPMVEDIKENYKVAYKMAECRG